MAEVCFSDVSCIDFLSHIPCEIDLIEPYITADGKQIETHFVFEPDRIYHMDFTYKVGYPAGERFRIFFFRSIEDVLAVVQHTADPESIEIQSNQPRVTFSPRRPVADATGILKQEGNIRILMPTLETDLEADEQLLYFGVLAMYQPEEN